MLYRKVRQHDGQLHERPFQAKLMGPFYANRSNLFSYDINRCSWAFLAVRTLERWSAYIFFLKKKHKGENRCIDEHAAPSTVTEGAPSDCLFALFRANNWRGNGSRILRRDTLLYLFFILLIPKFIELYHSYPL